MRLRDNEDNSDEWAPFSIQPSDDDGVIRQIISNWARLDAARGFALLAQVNRWSDKDDPNYGLYMLMCEGVSSGGHRLYRQSYVLPFPHKLEDVIVIMRAFDREHKIDNPLDPLRLIFAKKVHLETGRAMHHTEVAEQLGHKLSRSDFTNLSWHEITLHWMKEIEGFGEDELSNHGKEEHRLNLTMFSRLPGFRDLNGGRPPPQPF